MRVLYVTNVARSTMRTVLYGLGVMREIVGTIIVVSR